METVSNRRASVFSNRPVARGLASRPLAGRIVTRIETVRLGALFSDVYTEENNCMSGIAMFMVRTNRDSDPADSRRFATIKAIRDTDIPVL